MIKKSIRGIVLITIFICSISISVAQKTVKEAIRYAESIVDNPVEMPMKNVSYLTAKKGAIIRSIDLRDCNITALLVSPSAHILGVIYSGKEGHTEITHLVFNFEAEKYYYLDYEIIKKHILASGGVRFFITEITDAIQLIEVQERASMERAEAKARFEKQESFLAYQRSNPNLLEGIWKGETKRLKNTFYLQYTFNGDKMTFEGKSKHAGMKPYVMEGRLIFSENTIVLLVEKVTENGKEQKNFKTKYIWYYTLIDDVLHLEGGNTAGGGALIWETNGEFRKTR